MSTLPIRRAGVLGAAAITLAGCGGGAARRSAAAPAGPPPDVVRQLQVPPSPYQIIYYPPVSLAKPADTTAHARKRGS
jgi:hypothetical protein